MWDDPLCPLYAGSLLASFAGYVYFEKRSWEALNGALEEISSGLDKYAKKNRQSWKKEYEINCELRLEIEHAIKGIYDLTCPPFTGAKRTKVRNYLTQFLDENRKIGLKDARKIAKELGLAAEGKSREINRQSSGGL